MRRFQSTKFLSTFVISLTLASFALIDAQADSDLQPVASTIRPITYAKKKNQKKKKLRKVSKKTHKKIKKNLKTPAPKQQAGIAAKSEMQPVSYMTTASGGTTGDTLSSSTSKSTAATIAAPSALSIYLINEFYGPSITQWGAYRANLATGAAVNTADPIQTDTKIRAFYALDSSISVGLGVDYNSFATTGGVFPDPYLILDDSSLYKSGGFNLATQLRLYVPVSTASREANVNVTFRLIEDSTYQFDNSRFSLLFEVFGQNSLYQEGLAQEGNFDSIFYAMPMLYYMANSQWQIGYGFKQWMHHTAGDAAFNITLEPTLMTVGTIWSPVKSFSLNPYLDMSVGNGLSADTTVFGMDLSWKFL